jgi:hypothetical protein
MTTTELNKILTTKLHRRIFTADLNEIAINIGKKLPPHGRHGSVSYQWEETEIPTIIKMLQ